MRVRWTTDAADDLERICDEVASLDTFPNRGRLGRIEGTRELVFAPLPGASTSILISFNGASKSQTA